MSGMAWAFNIQKKKDSSGNEVEVPWNKYTSLLIAKPDPFQFDLTVRSEDKRKMIVESGEAVNGM